MGLMGNRKHPFKKWRNLRDSFHPGMVRPARPWTGKPSENKNLHCTVTEWTVDVGVTASYAKALFTMPPPRKNMKRKLMTKPVKQPNSFSTECGTITGIKRVWPQRNQGLITNVSLMKFTSLMIFRHQCPGRRNKERNNLYRSSSKIQRRQRYKMVEEAIKSGKIR